MHNSDVKPVFNTCKWCGIEVKEGKDICFRCDAAKEIMQKGVEHVRSNKAVAGLKQIDEHGIGWAQTLLF